MAADATIGNTFDVAFNEICDLLGLRRMTQPILDGIIKNNRSVSNDLHGWLVGLCLGYHFDENRKFTEPPIFVDGNLGHVPDPSGRTTKDSKTCQNTDSLSEALNIYAYCQLEYLQYPRLEKITLDGKQNPQELFLALVFLISQCEWLERVDVSSEEYKFLKKCLMDAVCAKVDVNNLPKYDFEATSGNLPRTIDKIGDKSIYRPPNTTLSKPKGLKNGTSENAPFPRIPVLNKTTPLGRLTRKNISNNDESENGVNASSKCLLSSSNQGLLRRKPLFNRTAPPGSLQLPRLNEPHALTRNAFLGKEKSSEATEKAMEDLEKMVVLFASDVATKARLLSRRKNAKAFDTELLRLVIGKNEYLKKYHKLMATNISLYRFSKNIYNIPKLHVVSTRESKIKPIGILSNKGSEALNDSQSEELEELKSLIHEIAGFSNVIVQLQFRIHHLSTAIEGADSERLRSFARLTDDKKVYEKARSIQSQNGHKGIGTAFINDRYKIPSPAEWLLISDKLLFSRHLALLKFLSRALDNEIRRTVLWKMACKVLVKLEPDVANFEDKNSKKLQKHPPETYSQGFITLYTKPAEIKHNVYALKSFLVEGIPSENFKMDKIEKESKTMQGAVDFLRQVNSNFANYRSGCIADEKGRKGSFWKFLLNELKLAEKSGELDPEDFSDTSDAISKPLHLFEDSAKHNPRLRMFKISRWIKALDTLESLFQISPSNELGPLNDALNVVDKREDVAESQDFITLENLANYGPPKNAKSSNLRSDFSVKNSEDKLSNILNFGYYFGLSRDEYLRSLAERQEIVTETSCYAFSKNLEENNSKTTENHSTCEKKVQSYISQVTDYITSLTGFVFTD